jgi:hypothetical protein
VKVLLIGVGAKICYTGNTDSVVAESIFTTIGLILPPLPPLKAMAQL